MQDKAMKQIYNIIKENAIPLLRKQRLAPAARIVSNMNICQQRINSNEQQQQQQQQAVSLIPLKLSAYANQNTSISYKAKHNMCFRKVDITGMYMLTGFFNDEARLKGFFNSFLVGHNKIFPEGTQFQEIQYQRMEFDLIKIPILNFNNLLGKVQVKTDLGDCIIILQRNVSHHFRELFCDSLTDSEKQIRSRKIKGWINIDMKGYKQDLPMIIISIITDKLFDDSVPCISYLMNTQQQPLKNIVYMFIEVQKFEEEEYDQLLLYHRIMKQLAILDEEKKTS